MTVEDTRTGTGGLILAWQEERATSSTMGFLAPSTPHPPSSDPLKALRDDPEGHVLVLSRSGGGKNRSCVMPWLLSHEGSALTIDLKGENGLVCARFRRDVLGHEVHAFNPFGVQQQAFADRGFVAARFNPLDDLDPDSEDFADDCMTLAEDIAGPQPSGLPDPFWHVSALSVVASHIAWHVCAARFVDGFRPEDRTLGGVWRSLCAQDLAFRMATILDSHAHRAGFPEFVREEFSNFLQGEAEKVRTSIRSTATSLMRVFSSPRIQQATSASDFSLAALADPDRGFDLFLVYPPERLASHAAILRILLGRSFMAIARRRVMPTRPTLVVLDELPQLGALPSVKTAVTLLRGFGTKVVMSIQSMSQLRGLWPLDHATIIENATLLNFGNASASAARDVCSQLGDIDERSLLALDSDQLVVHLPGRPTVIARKLDYLKDAAFKGFDDNPYYAGRRP